MPRVARLPANDRAPPRDRAPLRKLRTPKLKYHAFLSYSHKDEALADWLHQELESFRVPPELVGRLGANGTIPKRLTPIFRDQHELAAADDLGEEIEEALASTQFLIVLCSPAAACSHWTNAEIATFKRSRPDGCILAAIAEGEPFAGDLPGREAEECFPPALREKYDRRGRPTGKRAEPLAADLRDNGGDGRRMGFLKLVAGMLGVGLDDLVQRETTQRHRRFAWLAAASLAGMTITSGLALVAVQARDAARDQRREAEGLVAFMVGDLKDKLEPIGKLDALDGVGDKVLAYYRGQDASELSDAALLQRSRALSLSAQIAYLRGDFDGATRLYREAADGTGEAVERSPDDPRRLFDHAQNVFWIGDLARRRGEIKAAEREFREYRKLANQMVAIEPDNLKWRMEVQYARENLGIVLMSQRRFSEAGRQFANALGPMQSLAAVDPSNLSYQHEVANALGWLADARRSEGRLDEAIAIRQRQIALLARNIRQGTTDVGFRERLTTAHQAHGLLLAMRGQLRESVDQFSQSVVHADQLITIEPENSVWRDQAASARLMLGQSYLSTGQRAAAGREAAKACVMISALRARDTNVSRWQKLQTDCLALGARISLADGNHDGARSQALRALASARSERSGDAVDDRYRVAAIHRLIGDIMNRSGDRAQAEEAWLAGFTLLPPDVAERPTEMNERAQLLRRLNRADQARAIESRLAEIGFHSP